MSDPADLSQTPDQPAESRRGFGVWSLAVVGAAAALVAGLVGYGFASSGPEQPRLVGPGSQGGSIQTLELGETATTPTGGQVSVLTWDLGAEGWPPAPGAVLSHAVVRFCSGEGVWNFRLPELPPLFSLVDAAGGVHPPMDAFVGDDEFNAHPLELVSPGECATGTIVFDSPPGVVLDAVRFSGNATVQWNIADVAAGKAPAPSPSFSAGIEDPAA